MKYIELTEEMEKTLGGLCDMALKATGMQAHAFVSHVIASIKEKTQECVPCDEQK